MQVKLKFSLVLFLATSLFGFRALAQDEGRSVPEVQELNQQHPELNLNDDKTLLMDADTKASKGQSNNREASVSNQKFKVDNQQSKPSSSEKTEEDPLSFNFLYFIIQKFKISDIVDD
jgi:hypothetical protein